MAVCPGCLGLSLQMELATLTHHFAFAASRGRRIPRSDQNVACRTVAGRKFQIAERNPSGISNCAAAILVTDIGKKDYAAVRCPHVLVVAVQVVNKTIAVGVG